MNAFVAVGVSGLALGAVYFLIASGLSLIYGLMDVLNFAHGAFLTLGAYAGWAVTSHFSSSFGPTGAFAASLAAALLAGLSVGALTEVVLVRPLYGRPVSQILATVGLDLALVGLLFGVFGSSSQQLTTPGWLASVTTVGAERVPNGDFLAVAAGLAMLGGLTWFLRKARYGLIVRAGVENREMVRALGIDVGRAFTLVFMIGGAAAGLAGFVNTVVFESGLIDPTQGDQLLIFAFIVVVIGGLGSVTGSAVAALVVGLVQVYVAYYVGSEASLAQLSNLSVVILLALAVQLRPGGLFGAKRLAHR
jgi:branched-chain amino acid transport system permease protein